MLYAGYPVHLHRLNMFHMFFSRGAKLVFCVVIVKIKSFAVTTWAHRAALISVSVALSQKPAYTARLRILGWCIARHACLMPSFRWNAPAQGGRTRLS